jgi:hypothetical protein
MRSLQQDPFSKVLFSGSLFGLVGGLLAFIGMLLALKLFEEFYFGMYKITITFYLLVVIILECLTFLSFLFPQRLLFHDERPGLLAIFIFLYTPFYLVVFQPARWFLLNFYCKNAIFDAIYNDIPLTFGFFLIVVGLFFLFIAFFLHSLPFLYLRVVPFLSKSQSSATRDKPNVLRVLSITFSILIIIGIIFLILGLLFPPHHNVTGEPYDEIFSFINGYNLHFFNLNVLFLIFELLAIFTVAIIVLLSSFSLLPSFSSSLFPVLFYLLFLIAIPSIALNRYLTTPDEYTLSLDTPFVIDVIQFIYIIFYKNLHHPSKVITPFGWLLFVGALIILYSFVFGLGVEFFTWSAMKKQSPEKASNKDESVLVEQ